jgi:hypothetical protein
MSSSIIRDKNPENYKTPLVNHHFAILAENEPIELYLVNDIKDRCIRRKTCTGKIEDTPWRAKTTFPRLSNDVLLFMCMMGGKYHKAMEITLNNGLSFNGAVEKLFTDAELVIEPRNSDQKSNDGMLL